MLTILFHEIRPQRRCLFLSVLLLSQVLNAYPSPDDEKNLSVDANPKTALEAEQRQIDADISGIQQMVVVGHGINMRNLNNGHQLSYFMVYDKEEGLWRSYLLPRLTGDEAGNDFLRRHETRESLPIVGRPTLHRDGTIYIAAAGGVVNRLKPRKEGGFVHSYVILGAGKSARDVYFTENASPVTLLAEDNEIKTNPRIKKFIDGVEIEQPFFHDYQNSLKAVDESFSMPIASGLITPRQMVSITDFVRKNTHYSITRGYTDLAALSDKPRTPEEEMKREAIIAEMTRKDGPTKNWVVKIWDDDKNYLLSAGDLEASKKKSCEVAESLKPGLCQEWHTDTLEKDGKFFFKAERLPLHKTLVAEVPGDDNQMIVSIMGNLYRIDHQSDSVTHLGEVPAAGDRQVDCTGLLALDASTFLMSDMGHIERPEGDTLRVISLLENGSFEVNPSFTDALKKAHIGLRGPDKSNNPRVKSFYAARSPDAEPGESFTLFLRTKHLGPELVKIPVTYTVGQLSAEPAEALHLSDTYNTEYFTAVGSTLISTLETEDVYRMFHAYLLGHVTEFTIPQLGAFVIDTECGHSQHYKRALQLPAYLPYTRYGLDGICFH
ncbi:MAG: hypothetical protein ACR2PT_02660 [Endozoicomonas sp.]